jgi:hypothetical protein
VLALGGGYGLAGGFGGGGYGPDCGGAGGYGSGFTLTVLREGGRPTILSGGSPRWCPG